MFPQRPGQTQKLKVRNLWSPECPEKIKNYFCKIEKEFSLPVQKVPCHLLPLPSYQQRAKETGLYSTIHSVVLQSGNRKMKKDYHFLLPKVHSIYFTFWFPLSYLLRSTANSAEQKQQYYNLSVIHAEDGIQMMTEAGVQFPCLGYLLMLHHLVMVWCCKSWNMSEKVILLTGRYSGLADNCALINLTRR